MPPTPGGRNRSPRWRHRRRHPLLNRRPLRLRMTLHRVTAVSMTPSRPVVILSPSCWRDWKSARRAAGVVVVARSELVSYRPSGTSNVGLERHTDLARPSAMEQSPTHAWAPQDGPMRPARLSVGIISAGRVGTALGVALERAGHVVVACSAISQASLQRAERRLPDTAVLPVHEVAGRAELLLIAVPDSELASVVSGLAATHAVRPKTIVVHTSGANGIAVLSPLTEQDCIPLAIHPAMTFTGADEDVSRLPDTCFGIAADDVGYAVAQSLVLEIGGEPFRVREDARPLYHAALAHASNHVVTVVLDAVEALRAALWGQELLGQELVGDGPGGIAERVVGPLARAAMENALNRGQAALTGPVARGDAGAVAEHLRALAEVDPELAQTYRSNSLRTAQRAHAPDEVFAVLDDKGLA